MRGRNDTDERTFNNLVYHYKDELVAVFSGVPAGACFSFLDGKKLRRWGILVKHNHKGSIVSDKALGALAEVLE